MMGDTLEVKHGVVRGRVGLYRAIEARMFFEIYVALVAENRRPFLCLACTEINTLKLNRLPIRCPMFPGETMKPRGSNQE